MEHLKIAIVSTSFPPLGGGGIQSSHYNLSNALKKCGATVEVFTFCDGFVRLKEADVHRGGLPHIVEVLIAQTIWAVFKILRVKGIAYQFTDALLGSLGGIAIVPKLKRFRPDIVIVPDHGAPSALWPRKLGCKVIYVSHHNSARFQNEPLYGLHSSTDAKLALKIEQRAVFKADMVLCPSEYMREMFCNTYSFSGGVGVIPNIIDSTVIEETEPAALRALMGLSGSSPLVYIPSADSPYKGSAFVFEIMRRLAVGYGDEIGFYLSGQLNEEQRRLLAFLPSNTRYHTPGHVNYLENISNIKVCNICISPTLTESFGMAILEAQFSGLPAVVFDVGGNREIVVTGETGYLVPCMDIEALIGHALDLLADPALCAEMSVRARKRSMAVFGVPVVLNQYAKLFRSLLGQPTPRKHN